MLSWYEMIDYTKETHYKDEGLPVLGRILPFFGSVPWKERK